MRSFAAEFNLLTIMAQNESRYIKVGNIAELVRMTPDELKLYNISIDTYRTNLSIMKNERAEGRAEGIAEERAKAESEKLDSARQLLGMGLPATKVALALKLPLERVNALVE